MRAQVCVHSIFCLFSPRYRCVMLQEYLSKVFHLMMGGKGVGAFGLGQWITFMTDPVHRNLILILMFTHYNSSTMTMENVHCYFTHRLFLHTTVADPPEVSRPSHRILPHQEIPYFCTLRIFD